MLHSLETVQAIAAAHEQLTTDLHRVWTLQHDRYGRTMLEMRSHSVVPFAPRAAERALQRLYTDFDGVSRVSEVRTSTSCGDKLWCVCVCVSCANRQSLSACSLSRRQCRLGCCFCYKTVLPRLRQRRLAPVCPELRARARVWAHSRAARRVLSHARSRDARCMLAARGRLAIDRRRQRVRECATSARQDLGPPDALSRDFDTGRARDSHPDLLYHRA